MLWPLSVVLVANIVLAIPALAGLLVLFVTKMSEICVLPILCHIMPSPMVFPCEQPRKFGLPKLDFLGYPMVKTI